MNASEKYISVCDYQRLNHDCVLSMNAYIIKLLIYIL